MGWITAEGDGDEVEEDAADHHHWYEYLVSQRGMCQPLTFISRVSLCCLVPVLGKERQYRTSRAAAGEPVGGVGVSGGGKGRAACQAWAGGSFP